MAWARYKAREKQVAWAPRESMSASKIQMKKRPLRAPYALLNGSSAFSEPSKSAITAAFLNKTLMTLCSYILISSSSFSVNFSNISHLSTSPPTLPFLTLEPLSPAIFACQNDSSLLLFNLNAASPMLPLGWIYFPSL